MGYVSPLMGLLFYVYAIAGVLLFGKNDPVHFGKPQSWQKNGQMLPILLYWV